MNDMEGKIDDKRR